MGTESRKISQRNTKMGVGNTDVEQQQRFCRRSQYIYSFTSEPDIYIHNVIAIYNSDVTWIIINYGVVNYFKC